MYESPVGLQIRAVFVRGIDGVIAVVVDVIGTVLPDVGVHILVRVVAVTISRNHVAVVVITNGLNVAAVAVAVRVLVPHIPPATSRRQHPERRLAIVLVDDTVAVVVDVIAHLVSIGVHIRILVVAVARDDGRPIGRCFVTSRQPGLLLSPTIPVSIQRKKIGIDGVVIHLPVAVVIDVVAALEHAGMDRIVAVVAVSGVGHVTRRRAVVARTRSHVRITVAVVVRIAVQGGASDGAHFVDLAVAVLVDPAVADLARRRADGSVVIVTIVTVSDVARRLIADGLTISATVAITVGIPTPPNRVGRPLVDVAITIIVETVARFCDHGVGGITGLFIDGNFPACVRFAGVTRLFARRWTGAQKKREKKTEQGKTLHDRSLFLRVGKE